MLVLLFPAELRDGGDGLGAVHSHAAAGEFSRVHESDACTRDRTQDHLYLNLTESCWRQEEQTVGNTREAFSFIFVN